LFFLFITRILITDGVHVQFLDLEDLEADPDGNSVQGENSDEIIFHRSQAEAGINVFVSLFLLLPFFTEPSSAGNADSQAWLGTQLYWGAMGLERNQVEAVCRDVYSSFTPFASMLNPRYAGWKLQLHKTTLTASTTWP
jgi:hypothetical protein